MRQRTMAIMAAGVIALVAAAHFSKARKIGEQDVESIGAGTLADKSPCRLGPGAVATDHDDSHSYADEAEHRVEPDT